MKRDIKQIMVLALLVVSVNVGAQKAPIYSDQSIIIYADNTVVSAKTGKPLVFSESKKWVEEDYFTQQEKYCEVSAEVDQTSIQLKLTKPIPTRKGN